MDILELEFFVEVQYDIFKILSPNNIYRSLPSVSHNLKRIHGGIQTLRKMTENVEKEQTLFIP